MKRILISGGTGFVGQALVRRLLERGDEVHLLTRNKTHAAAAAEPGLHRVLWQPLEAGPWLDVLSEVDAVVHLAGEPVLGRRWNDQVKQEIWDSRVVPSRLMVERIAQLSKRPEVYISASGVGYYGHRHEPCVEGSPAGDDYLSQVTQAWEATADQAEASGVRVVKLRLGVVLGAGGGALEQMVTPFRLFVGGPIGSGKHWMSWIHLHDLTQMLLQALDDPRARGAFNATSPNPVTSAELSRALGAAIRRPSWLPVPEFALKLRFGGGAAPLTTGQAALPQAFERLGFQWQFPEIYAAMKDLLTTGG